MSEVLAYAVGSRANTARALLSAACQATGIGARLELHVSGALYQRLGPRRAAPWPDLVFWFGPYAARAAALDGLLQPHQPARVADGVVHDPDWRWIALDYSPIGATGPTPPVAWMDLASVPSLAFADPERSEAGLSILLATLAADVERGWQWWQQRAQRGILLTEDDPGAPNAVLDGKATHSLSLRETASPLNGLTPLPHAVGIAATSRNVDAARRMLDWLAGPEAAKLVPHSIWQAGATTWPDVEWGRQQYAAARRRWATSGFGPTLAQ